jgi:hypothetical protein
MNMDLIKQEFAEKGYVVIPNILNNQEIIEYIEEFNKWMDSIPDSDHLHSIIDHHGIFKYFQVGHQRFAWLLRTNPKVLNVFKSLWDTNELVVSFDGCCYYPPDYKGQSSYWIHSDQSPIKKGLQCIQSFVSLTSNKERTFVVYEGSHKLHEDHSNTYNMDNPSDWYPIKKEYVENIEDRKRILHVEAGSLVLWDSRTFHQNTCGPENCNEERLIQYLCYLPKNNEKNNEDMHNFRIKCFENLRTTNHYPYPVSPIHPQPYTYNYYNNNNLYIDYFTLKKPELDDLIDKIFDLL